MTETHNRSQAKIVAGMDPKLLELRQACLTEAVKLHGFTKAAKGSALIESTVVRNTAEQFVEFLLHGKTQ